MRVLTGSRHVPEEPLARVVSLSLPTQTVWTTETVPLASVTLALLAMRVPGGRSGFRTVER